MQKNKYLDDLGISKDKYGINWADYEDDDRQVQWSKEREEYGFDTRETWNLDHLLIEWLYSHLMMYKEKASKTINFTCHKFSIPVLYSVVKLYGTGHNEVTQKIEERTEIECINLCLIYFGYYLQKYEQTPDPEIDEKALQYAQTALKIVAEILPTLWW